MPKEVLDRAIVQFVDQRSALLAAVADSLAFSQVESNVPMHGRVDPALFILFGFHFAPDYYRADLWFGYFFPAGTLHVVQRPMYGDLNIFYERKYFKNRGYIDGAAQASGIQDFGVLAVHEAIIVLEHGGVLARADEGEIVLKNEGFNRDFLGVFGVH